MRKVAVLIAAVVCAACSDSEPAAPAEQETVFDPMVETLERAEQVEELQRSRMDTLNEQLEQAEGGGENP